MYPLAVNSTSNSNHLYSIKTIEYKFQNRKMPADDRPVGRTDRHIILPLRGFDFVACVHMRCAQLQVACL